MVARAGLLRRLDTAPRVMVVSAPAGSGKTVLLRSWIGQTGLGERAGWVAVERGERDPQRFWLSVLAALRATTAGAALVRPLTAAPDLDGWLLVERLLADLAPLRERLWLVVDDVHELGPEALGQLELLIMRAPAELRFVLAARHDVRLGLHRLRLEEELAEIRAPDLRFSLAEARELFAAAEVELPEVSLAVLHERTEGWAAGLRLAALSLAGHPDPVRFAAEFSGSERTVAEYLVAEVLDRQDERARRLLLRTSVLERVNGELADLLTGDEGGERTLQDLEQANALVVSLDSERTWFRYHQMFAELLMLELRRAEPGEVAGLHRAASGWFAVHAYPVEAVRHAQAAREWGLAARLLADHWPGLYLDGKAAAVHELLAEFPARTREGDAELAAVAAVDELASGSVEAAQQYLGLAETDMASVPDARQGQAGLLLGIARLLLARHRADLPAVVEEAGRLRAMAEVPGVTQLGLSEDLRALALINLGITEYWTARYEEAERHLEQGVGLARRIGRPFLEFTGQAYEAAVGFHRSFAVAAEKGMQAVELARVHGWTDQPAAGIAYGVLGVTLEWQGRLDEAEPWIQRAERTVKAEAEPMTGMGVRFIRGILEVACGRFADALAAFQAVEQMGGRVAAQHQLIVPARAWQVYTLVRLGESGRAGRVLAGFGDQVRDRGEARVVVAVLRLAQDDPGAAVAELAPILDGSVPAGGCSWLVHAFLLEAAARDALGDPGGAEDALERALDQAEPDGMLLPFLLHPVLLDPAPGLLERHAPHRTAHAALLAEIRNLLAGSDRRVPPVAGQRTPLEPLRDSELRVLRYLPTNLTAPDIAAELSVSLNTVKTHMRNLYAKLGTHRRAETVARARELGLLAPSARPR